MAIALAASQDHIATVFDSADSLLIIEAGPERKRRIEAIAPGISMIQIQQRLRELNVNVLLCGAIASFAQQTIEGAGIIVIPFLKGNLADVEAGFFANRLDEPAFYLPGCRRGWAGRSPGPCGGGPGGNGYGSTGKRRGQRRKGRS